MASQADRRKTFIDSLIPFLQLYGFEGVDLDWEYPGDREGSDPENDRENFSILVEEMGAALKKHNFLFSAAVTPSKFRLRQFSLLCKHDIDGKKNVKAQKSLLEKRNYQPGQTCVE